MKIYFFIDVILNYDILNKYLFPNLIIFSKIIHLKNKTNQNIYKQLFNN